MPAATLYRDTGYSLSHMVEDIRVGKIGLPDIQRPFVWSNAKVRDLMDSLYRGYPVGTLMFWETAADVGTRRIGTDEPDRAPQMLVVDGQQRLTALYAVITGRPVMTKSFVERQIRIAFKPADESFEVLDAAIARDPEYIPDITALWTAGYKNTVRAFLQRLGEARPEGIDHDLEDMLEERVDRVRDLREFRFQVIELAAVADEEQVAEIFVRINSEGVKLNQSDFILTLMSVHWDKGRRQLEEFARSAVDPQAAGPNAKNPFIDPTPDQMLRAGIALAFKRARLQAVYNLLRGKDLATGRVDEERRREQFERLAAAHEVVLDMQNWHEYLKCLQAAGFRSRKMITSETAVIYTYALWLIGRRDFGLSHSELRPVIARWFFMAVTTSRYSSSPESILESDLNRLSDIPSEDKYAFIAELDRQISSNFTKDYWEISLPNRLDTSASFSPVLFAYLAALNLFDAEVLFSEVRVRDLLDPGVSAPRGIERHHLYPKAHLAQTGVAGTRSINSIANLAYLDWSENSAISSTAPSDYWPVMTEGISPERLKAQARLHALPIGWEQLDYGTFLDRRRELMAGVVRDGFALLAKDGSTRPQLTTVSDLIKAGESDVLEFKSTARLNLHTREADPRMEHVIVKTVCGFLNHDGGTLLIGVADDGTILGLEHDLATLGSKSNVDGYELFLRQLVENGLTAVTAQTVKIRFDRAGTDAVCIVSVAASGRPVFARSARGTGPEASEFWVRIGNSTRQLHGEAMVEYQRQHW